MTAPDAYDPPAELEGPERAYFDRCRAQPCEWLAACVADPGPYMTPRHVAIARLALGAEK